MKLNKAQLIWRGHSTWQSEFKAVEQVALTLYGDAIHGPGDGGLGRATGPADQHAVLSRSQDEVPGSAADPIWRSWK